MTTPAESLCALLLSAEDIEQSVLNTLGTFPVFTGENEVSTTQVEEAVRQAADTYNIHRPHVLNRVVQGRGENDRFYRLTGFSADDEPDAILQDSWDVDFSTVRSVLYPVATRASLPDFEIADRRDDTPTELVRFAEYDLFERSVPVMSDDPDDPVPLGIEFTETWLSFQGNLVPPTQRHFLIEYTARHKFRQIGCNGNHHHTTVPQNHKSALTYLATSLVALAAAMRAEKSLDPPSGAQFVTMRDKGRGFQRISDQYRKLYTREIGVETTPAAATLVDLDISNTFTVTQRQGNVNVRGLSGQRNTRGRF